jgi:mono/diheme cytochrome c family protein
MEELMSIRIATLIAFSTLFSACGAPDGQALYDKKCAICHGDDANETATAPDIRARLSEMTLAEIEETILDGTTDMPAVLVSEDEAVAIAAWAKDTLSQ